MKMVIVVTNYLKEKTNMEIIVVINLKNKFIELYLYIYVFNQIY